MLQRQNAQRKNISKSSICCMYEPLQHVFQEFQIKRVLECLIYYMFIWTRGYVFIFLPLKSSFQNRGIQFDHSLLWSSWVEISSLLSLYIVLCMCFMSAIMFSVLFVIFFLAPLFFLSVLTFYCSIYVYIFFIKENPKNISFVKL